MFVFLSILSQSSPFLESMSLDAVRLVFDKDVFHYQVSVPAEIESIHVFATPMENEIIHIIKGAQEYTRNDAIPLLIGQNEIEISSSKGKYFIKIARLPKSNVQLGDYLVGIKIDGIPIKDFKSGKTEYSISVPFSKKSISINPITLLDSDKVELHSKLEKNIDFNQKQILISDRTEFVLDVNNKRAYHLIILKEKYLDEKYSFRSTYQTKDNSDEEPSINCPHIYGARPGTPFNFYVSTSGATPIKFHSNDLPEGLILNSDTGVITGTTPKEGTYITTIMASNSFGVTKLELTIKAGEMISYTPPMGWNTWYVLNDRVNSPDVRKMTDKLIEHNLHKYGYTYINIDDCWQGARQPEPPYALTPKKPYSVDGNKKDGFLDIAELVNYIHSNGLKAGIYNGPRISTYAGFLGSSSNAINGMDESVFSPNNGNPNGKGPKFDDQGQGWGHDGKNGVYQPSQYFGACWGKYEDSVGATPGKYWFGTADTKVWADWGIDFIKWDWYLLKNFTYTEEVTKQCYEDIIATKRDMILSLSNSLPKTRDAIQSVRKLGANMARLEGDINDYFTSILSQVAAVVDVLDLMLPGFWGDMDMLQIGYVGTYYTHLSYTEQIYQVSFWAIVPAPMLLSCDLNKMDDFTLSLLRNPEVNMINQDSTGEATKMITQDNKLILLKKLEDGRVACGVFVRDLNAKGDVKINFEEVSEKIGVHFPKGAKVRSVWERKDIGNYDNEFIVTLEQHQGLLFTLEPIQ